MHGTFWWPLGLAAGAGVVAGLLAMRGRRLAGGLLAAAAGLAAVDDLPPGKRTLRSALPRREATTVVGELGPPDADHTVVLVAHHDAAHAGLLYHPAIPELVFGRFPWLIERVDTSPPLMAPTVGDSAAGRWRRAHRQPGPAQGSGRRSRRLRRRRSPTSAFGKRCPARTTTPRAWRRSWRWRGPSQERPAKNVRVMLVSTSEEALCEGMQAFAERHFDALPRERTFFLCLDTLGSPHLLVLRGEGMIRMREYPARSLALLDGIAEELGISLFPNLRLRNATDGVLPLAAGYECASLCSCTRLKQPANYHWPTDVPENVDYGTLADAVRLTEAVVRRLDERWL